MGMPEIWDQERLLSIHVHDMFLKSRCQIHSLIAVFGKAVLKRLRSFETAAEAGY
jgi:hypothetical protein